MTPPGRKAKSPAQKRLEGNPGKRPIKEGVKLPTALPDPPATLTEDAITEWNRIAPGLFKAGILAEADRGALAACCQAWADWVEARAHIKGDLKVQLSPNGYPMQSPWVGIANKAMANYMKIASEFGLTPASRVRLAIEGNTPDDDQAKREEEIFGD